MDSAVAKQLRRIRTLGRGASGAVVWLASDDASGELLAVKSAGAVAAAQLRREGRVMEGLQSPHIVPCLGARAAAGGEYQLFLEFAPGGSLADEATRSGGRLAENDIRAYAGDVARGLAYLHGLSLVHGDVKARNVVIGADGRARLTDFGCARPVASSRPIGGTPAFMAPEVARGEAQGPAADVWALGCTVVEMATGRAPWSDVDDVLAAVHRIGYTDAVPEVPEWLSAEAKDFLDGCFRRRPCERLTAAQLLAHPFLASVAPRDCKKEPANPERPSPKTTLLDAFWDSDTDDEADEMSTSPAERIGALATSALPDWDSDEGWIDLQQEHSQATTEPVVPDCFVWAEPSDEDLEQLAAAADVSGHLSHNALQDFSVQNRASDGEPEQLATSVHIIHVNLPRVAGAVTDAATRSWNYCFRECKIQRLFDHDSIETAESHCVCNRNRAITKQISHKFPSVFPSNLHVRLAYVTTTEHFQNQTVFPCFCMENRKQQYVEDVEVMCHVLPSSPFNVVEIEHVRERPPFPAPSLLGKLGRSVRRDVRTPEQWPARELARRSTATSRWHTVTSRLSSR